MAEILQQGLCVYTIDEKALCLIMCAGAEGKPIAQFPYLCHSFATARDSRLGKLNVATEFVLFFDQQLRDRTSICGGQVAIKQMEVTIHIRTRNVSLHGTCSRGYAELEPKAGNILQPSASRESESIFGEMDQPKALPPQLFVAAGRDPRRSQELTYQSSAR
jgi:hypothetical protein